MKITPLTEKHIALGAKMAEFAGYNMPISYAGINDEHHAVRKSVGENYNTIMYLVESPHEKGVLWAGTQSLVSSRRFPTHCHCL